MVALGDRVLAALADAGATGLSEEQLAATLFGSPEANRLHFPSVCESLMANGEIERHGEGTADVSYTYHLPNGRVPRL